MQNSERQIGVIRDIVFTAGSLNIYDLYITDRRFVVIDRKNFKGDGGILWVGSNLFNGIEQGDEVAAKKQKELHEKFENLSLDEKLKRLWKNFAINHEEASQIILNDPHSPLRKATLKIISEKKHAKFKPTKEQFEQLADILPNIET